MSYPAFVRGQVRVTWHVDGTVDEILYNNEPYIKVVSDAVQPIQYGPQGIILPARFYEIIEELLASIISLSDNGRKVLLADRVFGFQMNAPIPNPKLKLMFLESILRRVWQWEDVNEEVHKGTIYYFIANAYLEQGDIPSAYIYFFNAMEEDRSNFPALGKDPKEGGAYLTTSLVDNPQLRPQLYSAVVVPLRNYLQGLIDGYNSRTETRGLTIQELDQKFLQADSMEDIKRFFVATLHEIFHLSPLNNTKMINNDYSKLKVVDTLFNLSLIIDQILEHRFLGNASGRQRSMGNAVYRLTIHLSWTNSTRDHDAGEFLGRVRPRLNNITPDQRVPALLNGSTLYNGQNISAQKMAMFLAYHLRNFAGHNIEGQSILVTRYSEVLTAIMDAFLTTVEVL